MSGSSSRAAWNVLLTLLIGSLLVTFLVPRVDLTTLRPQETVTPTYTYDSVGEVPVRLWEDPIAAVARSRSMSSPNQNAATGAKQPGGGTAAGNDQDLAADPSAPGTRRASGPAKEQACWRSDGRNAAKANDERKLQALRASIECRIVRPVDWPSPGTPTNGSNKVPYVAVLAVPIPGNPFPGSEDWRRRLRLAAVHGLAACGFAPENTESIPFAELTLRPIRGSVLGGAPTHSGSEPASARSSPDVRLVIPYEKFQRISTGKATLCRRAAGTDIGTEAGQVVVLWIDETRLGQLTSAFDGWSWIDTLALVLDALQVPPSPSPAVTALDSKVPMGAYSLGVIGPSGSGGLIGPADDLSAADCGDDKKPMSRPACLLSPWTTLFISPFATSGEQLLDSGADKFSTAALPRLSLGGLGYVRTLATDREVIGELIEELKQGGRFDACKNSVLAITEVDTSYAREMRQTLERAIIASWKCDPNDGRDLFIDANYLVDIDGMQPSKEGDTTRSGGQDINSALKSAMTPSKVEWPEARHQIDYVRRIAKLKSELRSGWLEMEQPVKLVALLGGVPYDKLILLKALREEFPSAVFITTDADARLLHPRSIPWTRGMLVGSAHGLVLDPRHQGEAPPFRDVYQTSSYLAFQVFAAALSDPGIGRDKRSGAPSPWAASICPNSPQTADGCGPTSPADRIELASPHVLEVGRDGFFDLTGMRLADHGATAAEASDVWPSPTASGHLASFSKAAPLMVLLIGGACVFWAAPTSRLLRFTYRYARRARFDRRCHSEAYREMLCLRHPVQAMQMKSLLAQSGRPRWHRWTWVTTFLVLVVLWVLLCIATAALQWDVLASHLDFLRHEAREPVSLTSGTSAWPTLTLRLVAILLTIILLDRMMTESRETLLDIEQRFFPGAQLSQVIRLLRRGTLIRRMLRVICENDREATVSDESPPRRRYSAEEVAVRDQQRRRVLLFSWLARHLGGYMYHIRGARRRTRVTTLLNLQPNAANAGEPAPVTQDRGTHPGRSIEQWRVEPRFLALTAWRHYRLKRFGPAFILRIGVWIVLALLLGIVAMNVAPPPSLPIHGVASRVLGYVIMYLSFSLFLFLLVLMIDQTWLAGSFVQKLSAHPTTYPRLTIELVRKAHGLDPSVTAEEMEPWIDVQIIGRMTRVVGSFLLSTFMILALLLLSRSPLFDQWQMHRGIVFTFGVLGTMVLLAMFYLQRKARQAKQTALDSLEQLRIQRGRSAGADSPAARQIKELEQMVETNREGAFAGMYENPIFQGAMFPLGGLSLIQMIEFMMTARP